MVDLIQAADLGNPNSEDSTVEMNTDEPSVSCHAVAPNTLDLSVYVEEQPYIASGLRPPDPLLVPIGDLPGFVTHDYSQLYGPCTRENKKITLSSWINIDSSELDNPDARLAMARLLVDMTNKARARFGCAESANALSLPSELPEIPEVGREAASRAEDPFRGTACSFVERSWLPEYEFEHGEFWAMGTPQPSGLISTCEIRIGNSDHTDGDVPGKPKSAFVMYEGPLAKARHESEKYSLPEYDVMCHGEPVSFRHYTLSEDDPTQWDKDPADQSSDDGLLDNFARAAAERAGCPLPK
ncbi:hypothetical protein J2S53_001532 [Actinopolyspora lacussalsi]|nr:hypothetical protein [Actinopolyspora lacussalsi]